MKAYLNLVREVLAHGTRKENRTGVDTISTFNVNYEIDLADGFPLLTTKEVSWKNVLIENMWFLRGERTIHFLRKHGCKFWDAWADENGRVPSAYGYFWRNFGELVDDQVEFIERELIRNPISRRLVVSAWEPENALRSNLPPCHVMWILNVQNTFDGPRLNMHLTQRSCDVALGLPYNVAGYAFLLELFSRFSGIPAGKFAHSIVDAHIYTASRGGKNAEYDHVPGLKEQVTREPRALPRLVIDPSIRCLADVDRLIRDKSTTTEQFLQLFKIEDYNPHPQIKFKAAV